MKEDREKWARTRIIIIGTCFGLLFLAVTVQAFRLQILQHEEMVKKADRQHQRVVPLTPARGTIMDRNGNNLAVSVEMDSCYAEPRNIQDLEGTAAVLAPFLGTTQQELLRKLNGNRNFVWLERRLTPEQAVRIKNLKLRGIGFAPETKRFYPNLEVAAHVIGFTGLDPVGLEGVERKYDSVILGNTGYIVTERDALGRNIALKNVLVKNSSPGKNLILTLDMTIQHIAEKELAKAVTTSQGKNGMALVMESDTGRILAMANYPAFNPNAFSHYPQAFLRNRIVADSFEPGSTFKIFLLAAAMEERLIKPGDVLNCENGSYRVADRTIHDTHSYARLTVAEILKYSSNIGAAKIGFKLGDERLFQYLRNFGFGERSGIDLPGESPGNLRDKRRWYGVDLATISFGQGVSASAIQLAAAVSAVANGGNLMKPYVVERILDDSGQEVRKIEPQIVRRVISPETAAQVTKMMEGVTIDGGTGLNAAVEGFRVAGKTGTAQKVDPVTRGYSATKRTASFIGFIPADKPKLTILVVVDEPKTSPYGGVVAAPAFHEIALNSLAYLKIVPPGAADKPRVMEAKAAQQKTAPPPPQDAMIEGGAMEEPGAGAVVMPDFRGMSMRTVLQVMEKRKINIRLMGSGRATEQNPMPGQTIRGGDEVWIKFTPSA
ncbi:penicillin-binding protein [Geobacter sp. SVR]|uniref:penicillin-binding protein n=1 Tax=Geobacter sp. SVR TaxID=2495594 RepID=UPI00143EF5C9|nr:penicillin-binding protein [Geobacter sp. SVR]BCS52289.1 penicillin-binding protein [Geobacter sp. SVR]GCF85052.1 penicillin-binding protein [Geobacter sp. SVR]